MMETHKHRICQWSYFGWLRDYDIQHDCMNFTFKFTPKGVHSTQAYKSFFFMNKLVFLTLHCDNRQGVDMCKRKWEMTLIVMLALFSGSCLFAGPKISGSAKQLGYWTRQKNNNKQEPFEAVIEKKKRLAIVRRRKKSNARPYQHSYLWTVKHNVRESI
jgi:hypothetical protein